MHGFGELRAEAKSSGQEKRKKSPCPGIPAYPTEGVRIQCRQRNPCSTLLHRDPCLPCHPGPLQEQQIFFFLSFFLKIHCILFQSIVKGHDIFPISVNVTKEVAYSHRLGLPFHL